MSFEFRMPSLEQMRATSDGLKMLRISEDDSFYSALITGCPGSGKTTVSLYRFYRLHNQGVDVRLITYQNLLVLAIRNSLSSLVDNPVREPKISTFHKWYCPVANSDFDTDNPPTTEQMISLLDRSKIPRTQDGEIIIDEGQDLPICVHQVLPLYFKRCFVGADNGQRVHKNGATADDIRDTLQARFEPCCYFELGANFRNTYETYRFARQFISRTNLVAWDERILARLQRENRRGPKPLVIAYSDLEQRNKHLRVVLDNADGNVAILCYHGPGPSRSGFGDSVDEIHDLVTEMGFRATKYHHGIRPVPDDLERYVVTTFISAKGMEFDTVVIPRINSSAIISEQWYVACTRSSGRLIVYHDIARPYYDPILKCCESDTYDTETLKDQPSAFDDDMPF